MTAISSTARKLLVGNANQALAQEIADFMGIPLGQATVTSFPNGETFVKIGIGGGQTIVLNILLSAAINFALVAAVVYFLVVAPYNRLRKKGEVEQAQDTELSLLTEIRDLLNDGGNGGGKHVTGPGTGPSPDTAEYTSADKGDKAHD